MRLVPSFALAGLLGLAATAQAAPVTYTLDPGHTMVLFSWSHFGFSHPSAELGLGQGTLVFDAADPARSSVQVALPLSGLDTHVKALDEHLKKADFFDADKYPTITFKSTKVEAMGGKRFKVTGDLTLHGVTRPVVLDATLNQQGMHPMRNAQAIGFDAATTIERSQFGIGAYVPKVSDAVTVHITTEGAAAK